MTGRRIDEAARPREPCAGGSGGGSGAGGIGSTGDPRGDDVRWFERRQPDGRRGSRGGRHFGARRNPFVRVRDLVETTPVLVQHPFQDGFGCRRVVRCDNPQAPAIPVFDGRLVLEQQREHGGVLAFRVGERRAAALQSRQGPAGVDRVAGRAGKVIERRLDGLRQRLRGRRGGIDPAGRVQRAFLRAVAPAGERVAAGVDVAGVLRCRPGAGVALAGRRVPA